MLFVFADTARPNKGQILYECFSFEEGHSELCRDWYRHYTFRLDDVTAKRHLDRMQAYYDSIEDDQPVKLKLVKLLLPIPKPKEINHENISSSIHHSSY